ncbi:hormogonium polysaccharide biosynthesis protein HpsA [Aliterella atlantica]|uniref:hormogonium polysaccharide biosynthesis protein HpsA n=1 Tax=Aliterella atlantica TaxID=1827278 RepID=UPI0006966C76|nr:hormogonium polysaccharide biosynthesis protein HpsA [Aliterella atlantica]
MSSRKQRRVVQKRDRQIWQLSATNCKQHTSWLLRCSILSDKNSHSSGFVLPTVAMVSLVVVLITTALVLRAFDRSREASNVRVDAAVSNAAKPGIDRARAKIDALLSDPSLPRDTPTDTDFYNALTSSRYVLGDETRLKLVYDINNNKIIEKRPTATTLEQDEAIATAWKFPVDTDNNGKFDSYTLYSIVFRSPNRGQDGRFERSRNPLEARTPPMKGALSRRCEYTAGTSPNLVGDSSWYKSGSNLTKSFFAYTATVPIDTLPISPNVGAGNYEVYRGNRGFSALEFQQDRSRVPLNSNAVLFQNDLELTPGVDFRMNGRIFTNANLLIGGHEGKAIRLYQISSKNSCFYKEQNSKITVGGNVGTGNVADAQNQTAVTVDLFRGVGNDPSTSTIDGNNKSTSEVGGKRVGYNDAAYSKRIGAMKQAMLAFSTTNPPTVASVNSITQYPFSVKAAFKAKIEAPGGSSLNAQEILAEQVETYLKDRTRRVPFAEVPAADGTGAILPGDSNGIDTSSGIVEPIAKWREPTDTNTGLALIAANLQQTQPEQQREDGVETYLGDRINVGNNLPAYWKNLTKYVTGPFEKQFLGSAVKWTNPSDEERYRTTQVVALPDVGISNRDGFWEDAAARQPATKLSNVGGLRIITGAGIYRNLASTYTALSAPSFLPLPPTILDGNRAIPNAPLLAGESSSIPYTLVWSDTMPMSGGVDNSKTLINESTAPADLRMRATAVYHYANNPGTSQTPIACVSSYYDPTNATTAKNRVNFDGGYGIDTASGKSNNGVVYPTPYTSDTDRFSAIASYLPELKAQAKLMFPNGRVVNEPLQQALLKLNGGGGLLDNTKPLSLAENSAIDTAICGIKILTDSSFNPSTEPIVPHGAIREASFLNAREVQAIHKTNNTTDYDLELEQRQPLEVRVTDLDMGQLAAKTIGTANLQEYLLPNSGIIYASRDDALLDLSDTSIERELLSSTDFKLDPTRRPNGIRLINGSSLERDDDYREEEKGLTLVTNLPAYIQGDFNLHQQSGDRTPTEEFTDTLADNWSDFYTRNPTLDPNFACRKGQSGCGGNGDRWRPATIISDAMTVLSGSFRDGFRDEGDYDLNNYAGIAPTLNRTKNGLWNNSFVPSALWWDTGNTDNAYPNEKTEDSYVGSYLTNAVTPIQRRVNAPEYVMEICRKVPVSECRPSDWLVGYDNNGDGDIDDNGESDVKSANLPQNADVTRLGAGTTASAALRPSDRRYARRVAFKRSTGNTLELSNWSSPNEDNITPIALGINNSGQVAEFPYTENVLPRIRNNALWFRTTTNTIGEPYNNPSYANNRPLAYTGNTKFTSPLTPEIDNVNSLNLPENNPASSYTVCTKTAGSSQKPLVNDSTLLDDGNCDLDTTVGQLNALDPSTSNTDAIVTPSQKVTNQKGSFASGEETTLTQSGRINVIDLGLGARTLGEDSTRVTTIKLVGDEDSIFVFQKKGGILNFASNSNCSRRNNTCTRKGVAIELDGVDPNNVFWALNADTQWNEVDSNSPHRMKGNFISKGAVNSLKNVVIEGRLLGVNRLPPRSNFVNSSIKAIASTDQPLLVPVLQIHTPEGTPSTNTNLPISGNIVNRWLQNVVANNATVNAVFVSGNSPSRPEESDLAGLHNFVRFQENWLEKPLNIQGSFIQLKRSAYATAPFANVLAAKRSANDGTLSIFGYTSTSYNGNIIPYYNPPTRQWGFDVGLLSQAPDLFAQKFTIPSATPPNEFFRQVGRDDLWVKTLLCAAQGSQDNYTYAVDRSERGSCEFAPSAYND